ncbi:glycerol-3-phosphate transporter permease [Enterococcus sp. JM4C]|uniref:carbohydrate ABC transporter permease n=1 Tax=Candidatus Enterococcus huntleyi TaxID=1857217 RepID=UPI001379B5EC|nr:sugar ABC transporter permease [Enterococcus sp. JM4C]KAF1299390.1 glycerol-3-phosphate transporter permease [Enterococcus sp. JM4C]
MSTSTTTHIKKGSKKKFLGKIEPWVYLLPSLIAIGLFTYYPFITNIFDSLHIVDSFGNRRDFIGIENYQAILENPKFIQAIGNTVLFSAITIPASLIIGLLLALVAREKRKTSPIYEAMYSLPMAMSLAAVAMIFQLMLNPTLGIINKVTGLDINWLKDVATSLPSLIFIETWLNIGFNFLFMLTAVRGIPDEILESAEIDGAVGLTRLFKIIIPYISPTILFLLVSSVAKTMITSGLTLILTQGGPDGATETIVSFIYKNAILNQNYNIGYAASVVGFVITFFFVGLSFIYEKKGVHYG